MSENPSAKRAHKDSSSNQAQQPDKDGEQGVEDYNLGRDAKVHLDHIVRGVEFVRAGLECWDDLRWTPLTSLLLHGKKGLGERCEVYLADFNVTTVLRTLKQDTDVKRLDVAFDRAEGWIASVVVLEDLDQASESCSATILNRINRLKTMKLPVTVIATTTDVDLIPEDHRTEFKVVALQELEEEDDDDES